jgi:hypothetical protein
MRPRSNSESGRTRRGRLPHCSNRLSGVALLAACALAASAAQAGAGECRAATAEQTNVLVELFTSEGCNSCPPADRWLSALDLGSAGKAQIVPVAWHVDYWDYIGWKDRFAQAAFSERQHRLAQIRRDRVVYTPQVLVQGQDFRRWAHGGFQAVVGQISARPARARIVLSIAAESHGGVQTEVSAELLEKTALASPSDYALVLAVTASGFTTRVRSGENAGRTLAHDHVAFGWRGPTRFGPDGKLTLHERLARPTAAPGGSGVAAFVQSMRTGEVLQALMLSECRG